MENYFYKFLIYIAQQLSYNVYIQWLDKNLKNKTS